MAGYIMMFYIDTVFCYIYMKPQLEKYKANTKHEPAFISTKA